MQYTYVSGLSGGERRRLYLLTVLMKNPNFLILDEPTNDLDLITLNILEEFLLNYRGCLIVVSHDRYFMNKLVDHLFIFEGDSSITDFNGTYAEWRDQKEADVKTLSKKVKEEKAVNKVEVAQKNVEKRKLTFKEKFELDQLEKEIAELEKEKADLNVRLNAGVGTHKDFLDWSMRIKEVMELVDKKSLRWLHLSELN
jgi:ATP-binding cassette subfamily F protein uup